MIDQKRLQESIDRTEIINLIGKSILTRDSGLWDQLAECYHSKAEFTSSWYKGNPADFFKVAAVKLERARQEGGEQKHVTSNHWIEINGDRAIAEADLILFMRRAINGVELDFATWSRRLQLIERENGEWKIYRRWVIYERDRMDPVDPTVPVDAYEGYRAQLQDIARSLGVRRLRFVDEPLAAALGYGLGIASDRNVLVVDIGGGTMHIALLRLTAAGVQQGHAEILAKQGRALGGDTVDGWLLDHVCRRMGYSLDEPTEGDEMRLWRRLMLAEACRVKEALFAQPSAEFLLTPPGVCRLVGPDTVGLQRAEVTRDDLTEVLRNGDAADGLFDRGIDVCHCLHAALGHAAGKDTETCRNGKDNRQEAYKQ